MATTLIRRIAPRLLLAFAAAVVLLLSLWAWVGQRAMRAEHERASLRLAGLFEASLHHAMLRRDLEGLAQLLDQVGGMNGMSGAALLDPAGEVRFASDTRRLGQTETGALAGLCLGTHCGPLSPPALSWQQEGATRALRVAYPVRNQARCQGCHGSVAARPINGVLVLDFAPMAAEREAIERASLWLLPAALTALVALALGMVWALQRDVLRPVARLAEQVRRIAGGDLAARSGLTGRDELAQLGQGVDRMARQLHGQMDALAAQRAFLQSLLDAAPDPMLLLGADHRIVTANTAYARLMGQPLAAIQNQPCHRISRALDEPCPQTLVHCPLRTCEASGVPTRTVMAFTRADGSRVDVDIHAAPLRAPDGSMQVVEIIRPLAEQVRFSQEQRLAAVGLLANGVAHEIHNPLASIRLALQSALRGLQSGAMPATELAEYLHLVDAQIDRCVDITQRLLRLSQPSAQPAQPVSVRAAIDDVTALLGEEIRQAGVALRVQAAPDRRVLADEGELRQVLLNLVHNALHAMRGGGTLAIDVRRADDTTLQLAVQDSGCGIDPEQMALIFLPFYSRRADGLRGTGMGLAICKSLVEGRGGHIAVTSTPGQGSRFTVTLPDADAARADGS
ncbi:MAG: HAMP domain-containing protein [Proteobacteria bacterium]|nr:HAMP domain-containing protein [Pseudomonadota bacterium]